MEHLPVLAILLPLVLCLATASQLNPFAAAQPQPIYDTDGHALTSDSLYHIRPAEEQGVVGRKGLRPFSLWPDDCPLAAGWLHDQGVPVSITDGHGPHPWSSGTDDDKTPPPPRLSSDVYISFNHTSRNLCMARLDWNVGWYDPSGELLVIAGRGLQVVAAESGSPDDTFRFRVERHEGGAGWYKLTSCLEGKAAPCRAVGVYEYSRRKLQMLAARDGQKPLAVVFDKCPPPCWNP